MSTKRVKMILVRASLVAIAAFVLPCVSRARSEITFEKDIEYANPNGQHLQLDMARPEGEGPFPAVVCIHGGGFRAGKREGYDPLIKKLAEHGYVAVTVTYRLAPKDQVPAAGFVGEGGGRGVGGELDSRLRGNDGRGRGNDGRGAGNLEQSSRVACVVNFYGPSDFTKSY